MIPIPLLIDDAEYISWIRCASSDAISVYLKMTNYSRMAIFIGRTMIMMMIMMMIIMMIMIMYDNSYFLWDLGVVFFRHNLENPDSPRRRSPRYVTMLGTAWQIRHESPQRS